MRFESVTGYAFGPLRGEQLRFAPGMNVIYGPNEAGKSTWHAALYAGLCGMRRGRGGMQSEDQAFSRRHRPWDTPDSWEVGAVVALADDRQVELRHDLAGRVDISAKDVQTGRDYSGEIMFDGAPDGSQWLGLNRRSFLSTACVRQADVLEVAREESANGLQDELQRAAATARQGSSAAVALARLLAFEREQVGTQQAPTRPLRQAQARVQEARREREQATRQHAALLDLSQQVEEARELTALADRDAHAASAARAVLDADGLGNRYLEARQISSKFPGGEPADQVPGEDDARLVTTTLYRWERRPTPVPPTGHPADTIRARIIDIEQRSAGDADVHASVRRAWEALSVERARLRQVEVDEPLERPRPETRGSTVEEIYSYARELSVPQPREPRSRSGPWSGIVTLAVLAIGGLTALAAGWMLPAVALLSAAAAMLIAQVVLRRTAEARPGQPEGAEVLRRVVEERGLPQSPEQLRSLAQDLAAYEQQQERVRAWRGSREERLQRVAAEIDELRAALGSRDAALADQDPEEAYAAYERACAARRELSSTIALAQSGLEARERADAAYKAAIQDLGKIESELRALAVRVAKVSANASVDECVTGLRDWERQRSTRLRESAEQRQQWGRLQALLGDSTIEQLEAEAGAARTRAGTLSTGIDSSELRAATEWLSSLNGAARLDALVADAARMREDFAAIEERRRQLAATIRNVAAAEEEQEAAELELARLQGLAEVVQLTRTYMESAVDRAHRSIAPVLRQTVLEWLPRVTNGRYTDCKVDPQTLAVEICGDGGRWRSAQLLSHGTAEQVYLLLRVALARHLTRAGEVCPLVLDDVVGACDTDRKREVLEMLLALSESVQVILFTHESEVRDWAQERCIGPRHSFAELDRAGLPAR
ncbi:MAG: AAA family ATPase [Dehalococcoidia bacterium]|nr:AAA family ATPase [Dehalococcoidia bacterium]